MGTEFVSGVIFNPDAVKIASGNSLDYDCSHENNLPVDLFFTFGVVYATFFTGS